MIASSDEQQRSKLQALALRELHRQPDGVGFPNLLGMTLREALVKLHEQASAVDVRGYGVVVRTVPTAGAEKNPKSRVTLVLENPD